MFPPWVPYAQIVEAFGTKICSRDASFRERTFLGIVPGISIREVVPQETKRAEEGVNVNILRYTPSFLRGTIYTDTRE